MRRRVGTYTLNEKREPVPCDDFLTWGRMFQEKDRHVAQTMIGKSRVSTVFLGLDHQFLDGPPLLFETMVFGGPLDGEMDRRSTWQEAEAMHLEMCDRVREANKLHVRFRAFLAKLLGSS